MYTYYINLNKDSKGHNEVHKSTCSYLLIAKNIRILGNFANAIHAVAYAKTHGFPDADGCYYCCQEAHRG